MWPFDKNTNASAQDDDDHYRKLRRIPVVNLRPVHGYVAVCPKGHHSQSVTQLLYPSASKCTEVCAECYLDFIAANVPGVTIEIQNPFTPGRMDGETGVVIPDQKERKTEC